MADPARFGWLLLTSLLLFVLDWTVPLGVGVGMLYAALIFLAAPSPDRWHPITMAVLATILIVLGAVAGPILPGMPLWVGGVNRALSVALVWISLAFALDRRREQDALQSARNELDARVQERTQAWAAANESLRNEIAERREAEATLRASERALGDSQRALQRSQTELRALTARLLTVHEEERRRISRELHDDVNQRLAMMVVELEFLERGHPEAAPELASRLRSLKDNLTELSEDIRHLAYRFHPSILDDLGLAVALRRLVDEFAARTKIASTFQEEPLHTLMTQPVATCLYRIAQEALNNVARHAKATRVEVALRLESGRLTLLVEDNGVGFNQTVHKQDGGSLGLVSMTERVHHVHGELRVTSDLGHGTTLRASVPLMGAT